MSDHDLLQSVLAEAKERQNKVVTEIKDSHGKQLELLRNAIADERRESSQVQKIFEDTLRTKYENMVQSLQEKIKAEQESRMRRALEVAYVSFFKISLLLVVSALYDPIHSKFKKYF